MLDGLEEQRELSMMEKKVQNYPQEPYSQDIRG
jgi:hypothetical protein